MRKNCTNFDEEMSCQYFLQERMKSTNFHRHFHCQTCVVSCRVMICIKTQHFKFNRILLLLVGLWPYKQTKLTQFQIILVLGILISCIVYQFTVLVFAEYTLAVLINVLSISLIYIIFVIAYNSFRINIDSVKWLLNELQHICDELRDENEIAIITKYGNTANRYTTIFTLFHTFNMTICLFVAISFFLDTALLVDKTHLRHFLQTFFPEFFVTSDSYMFLILYFNGACIGGIGLIGTGMTLVAYIKHACGMFKIASYRIEKAMTANILKNSLENETIIKKKIIHAVDIHRKAIKFCTLLFSSFQGSLFCSTGICVICLSINLYKITEAMLIKDDLSQLYTHIAITIVMFLYAFISNYLGQEVTDCNNHVILTVYNVRWYNAPLHIQRLILFFLQSGSKGFHPTFGGVFPLSIEFFATLTKASLSYFIIICSTQQ